MVGLIPKRRVAKADSDDSEDELTSVIPANREFRCLPAKRGRERERRRDAEEDDLFVIDTTPMEVVEIGQEPNAEIVENPAEGSSTTTPKNKEKKKGEVPRWSIRGIISADRAARQKMDELDDARVRATLAKAVVGPAFEKQARMAKPLGMRALKKIRKLEREKTKGEDWFDLPSTEMTEERKRDLELLMMRGALDPTRHYRKNDRAVLPKYFQVGTIVDAPEDYYSGQLTKKERKKSMLDEEMLDGETVQKKAAKYKEIVQKQKKRRLGAFQNSEPKRRPKDKQTMKKKR